MPLSHVCDLIGARYRAQAISQVKAAARDDVYSYWEDHSWHLQLMKINCQKCSTCRDQPTVPDSNFDQSIQLIWNARLIQLIFQVIFFNEIFTTKSTVTWCLYLLFSFPFCVKPRSGTLMELLNLLGSQLVSIHSYIKLVTQQVPLFFCIYVTTKDHGLQGCPGCHHRTSPTWPHGWRDYCRFWTCSIAEVLVPLRTVFAQPSQEI